MLVGYYTATSILTQYVVTLFGCIVISSRLVACTQRFSGTVSSSSSSSAVGGGRNRAAKLEFVSSVGEQSYRLVYATSSNLLTPSNRFRMDGQVIQVKTHHVFVYFASLFFLLMLICRKKKIPTNLIITVNEEEYGLKRSSGSGTMK